MVMTLFSAKTPHLVNRKDDKNFYTVPDPHGHDIDSGRFVVLCLLLTLFLRLVVIKFHNTIINVGASLGFKLSNLIP